ncbi:3030_t:CDS:2 [Ambispora gerdemannii]|uniref:3030_t:CDS:1 n=1 Tax=Ambispora gerdemannii TaxID=144530 RepID=A0A9N9G2U8_9GLOM|nr:3030_t:CDS:2 [Ambispora gerdemannii]
MQKNNDAKLNNRPSGFGTPTPQLGQNSVTVNPPFVNQSRQPHTHPPQQLNQYTIYPQPPPPSGQNQNIQPPSSNRPHNANGQSWVINNQTQQRPPLPQQYQPPQSQPQTYDNHSRSPDRVRSPNDSSNSNNNTKYQGYNNVLATEYEEQQEYPTQEAHNINNNNNSIKEKTANTVVASQKEISTPRFATSNRGQLLLTVYIEFGDDRNHAIEVHINDEPERLAQEFCRMHNATNPDVLPALVNLMSEEKRKRLGC